MSLPGQKSALIYARTEVDGKGKPTFAVQGKRVSARLQAARVRIKTAEGDTDWVDGQTAYVDNLPAVEVGYKFVQDGTAYEVVGFRRFPDPDLPQYTQLWLDAIPS